MWPEPFLEKRLASGGEWTIGSSSSRSRSSSDAESGSPGVRDGVGRDMFSANHDRAQRTEVTGG